MMMELTPALRAIQFSATWEAEAPGWLAAISVNRSTTRRACSVSVDAKRSPLPRRVPSVFGAMLLRRD